MAHKLGIKRPGAEGDPLFTGSGQRKSTAPPNANTTGTNVASEIAAGAGTKALGAAPAQDPCANGGQGNGQATSRGSGSTPGVFNGVTGDVAKLQSSIDKWNAVHADTGLKMHAFSGVSPRSVGGSKHPSGNAVDVVIVDKNGCAFNNLWNGDTPAFRAYESFASQVCQDFNGRIGWGGNFGGTYFNDTMHFQNGGPTGQNGRVCEGKKNPTAPNNSQPGNTRYDGPTTCQEANGGKGESRSGGGGGGGCGEGSGGCKPISSAAPAAAASMAQGQGLAANSPMGAALGAFGAMGANPMAAVQGLAQQALGDALGGVLPNGAGNILGAGGIGGLVSGGLSNALSQVTTQVAGLVQGIGGNILPSLTGVIPSLLQGGDIKGLMTGVIQNQISGLIGAGLPNLGGFGQVFNTALGAAASGGDLKGALMGSVSQIFGNATSALGSLPGFDITSKLPSLGLTNPSDQEGIADNLNYIDATFKKALDSKKELNAPFKDALSSVIKNPTMNGFTTMYEDYNSMITQGFGNLSNNLRALGTDLIRLGKLGDLTDLLNIGTPGQLSRQIVENGFGITSGLTSKLVDYGLSLEDLNNDENGQLLTELLAEINDIDVIENFRKKLQIDPMVKIENMSDLLDAENIFAESYDYNNFYELRDIALTLTICGGVGRLKTLSELGFIIASLETAELYEDLLEEKQLIRNDEYLDLSEAMPFQSFFSRSGPTVADFIGTLAGYVHTETLPRMDELLQELYDDPVTDDYYDLMDLLANTLSNPTIVNILGVDYVQVASTGGYTFGDYLTLDDAITDIVDAVESELEYIKEQAENDQDLADVLDELEAQHYRSAEFLAHEQKMRSKYGVNFGNPERLISFRGDGTSTNFPIRDTVDSNLQVTISGVRQLNNIDFTYNQNTQQIVFNTAPTAGSIITITYQADVIKPESKITDIWQLANSLETLALEVGHGGPADFLSRLVTDDYHGQRIMSIMMQSRNVQRLSNYGISCPSFSAMMSDGSDTDKTIDFINHTGIWSDSPSRAPEIWVQNATNHETLETYILEKYSNKKADIQPDLDVLMQNITRQLIFYFDGNLAISDLMLAIYEDNLNGQIYSRNAFDLFINYSDDLPIEGYVIGPYKEIISAITEKENLKNDIFNVKISTETENYLNQNNINLNILVTIVQKILTSNGSIALGISEGDFQEIFGVQSLGKALLSNIANNY